MTLAQWADSRGLRIADPPTHVGVCVEYLLTRGGASVPCDVFDLLAGGEIEDFGTGRPTRRYASRDVAFADLAQALRATGVKVEG